MAGTGARRPGGQTARRGEGGDRAGSSKAGGSRPGGQTGGRGGPAGHGAGRQRGPDLQAPDPETVFRDRDGARHVFADSPLKRVAARILTERGKRWRYRPFEFPVSMPSGSEIELHFDFYVYDNMDTVVRLILVMPRESREVWDRVGRFKQQYGSLYPYELWLPDTLARLQNPRARLGF